MNLNQIIIGIPTFNRSFEVSKLVKLLMNAISKLHYVSIIVIDNSFEKNPDLSALSDFSTNFDYIKNKENIGLDGSILKILQIANSKQSLLCFLCDDDEIYIKNFVEYLKFLHLNRNLVTFCQFDFGNPEIEIQNEQKVSKPATIKEYLRASFLPTICIDAKAVDVDGVRNFLGTNYVHLALINSLLQKIEDAVVFNLKVGCQKTNQTTRFDLIKTFTEGYIKALSHKALLPIDKIKRDTANRMVGIFLIDHKPILSLIKALPRLFISLGPRFTLSLALRVIFRRYLV